MSSATALKRGTKPAPRRELTPEFRDAIRNSGERIWALSALSGFGNASSVALSKMLYHPFAATPLSLERLQLLSTLIGYEGPILTDEAEA